MSHKTVFQVAGWSALLSVIASFGMFALIGGGRSVAFTAVSITSSILMAVALYGLYLFHRPQSAMLSLAMLLLGIVGLVLENIGSGPDTPLGIITGVIYAAAFLLLGYLGTGNAQMPRWLAILAYGVGLFSLAGAGVNAIGQSALSEYVLMIQFLVWVVWSVWLWRWFLSPKLVTAS